MARDITVTFDDGSTHVYRGAPDNVTPEQVTERASKEFGRAVASLDGGRKPQAQPSAAGRFLKDTADTVGGLVRGAGDIGATLLQPVDMAVRALNKGKPLEVGGVRIAGFDRRQAMDEAMSSLGYDRDNLAFSGGRLTSNIAGTAGAGNVLARAAGSVGAAPSVIQALASAGFRTGAAPVGVAARAADQALRAGAGVTVGGVSAGLADPSNAGLGAVVGGMLPGATTAAGAVGRAVGKAVRPNVANPELARKAIQEYGIPLGLADISGSNTTKAIRSVLNDAPLTGGIGARQREGVQQGFNRAVGKTFGADAPSLTPEILDKAKAKLGSEFDRIWGGNTLEVDAGLFQSMQALRENANKLPQGESARLMGWIDDFQSKMVPGPNGAPTVPGDVANRFQSTLRKEAEKATGFLKDDLAGLRKNIIGAFNRSVSPEDAAALAQTMGKYKAFKTVQPLLNSAEAGVAGRAAGDVPAGLLPNAVRQSYQDGISRSPFADLSQIGSQFVADRVARTGGSTRALVQNSAIGGALGAGALTNPLLALGVVPAGMGANALLGSPVLARLAMSAQQGNPQAQNAIAELLKGQAGQMLYRSAPVAAPAISGR
jgi:hypothetical protein